MKRRWFHLFDAPARPRLTLVCLPHAGGSAGTFRRWAAALPAGVALAGVQLPGRAERLDEPAHLAVPALVDALYEALLAEIEPPFVLFGHSLGALLAFELARVLVAEAMPPRHLILSGRRPPTLARGEADLHLLDDAAFVTAMRDRFDAIPAELLAHPEVLALLLPALRADMTLVERYRYRRGARLPVPITACAGDADRLVPATDLAGWGAETDAAFAVRTFAGGHFYFERDAAPLLAMVAQIAAGALAPARQIGFA